MDTTPHQFERIYNKVFALLQKVQKLEFELNELKKENTILKDQLKVQEENIKNFQNQEKISKIVSGVSVDSEKATELKLKINEYIKEIDKCISHLSEQ